MGKLSGMVKAWGEEFKKASNGLKLVKAG